MTTVPDRSTFESAYAGQAPWDIGRPQNSFIDVADRITGSILDAGFGRDESSSSFANPGASGYLRRIIFSPPTPSLSAC